LVTPLIRDVTFSSFAQAFNASFDPAVDCPTTSPHDLDDTLLGAVRTIFTEHLLPKRFFINAVMAITNHSQADIERHFRSSQMTEAARSRRVRVLSLKAKEAQESKELEAAANAQNSDSSDDLFSSSGTDDEDDEDDDDSSFSGESSEDEDDSASEASCTRPTKGSPPDCCPASARGRRPDVQPDAGLP
jgi:hypothetical protein